MRRTARAHPAWSATAIAARVGCHPDTVRRHLSRSGWEQALEVSTETRRQREQDWIEASTDRPVLARAAAEPDTRMRRIVAHHASTPPQVLARLTADPDRVTREAAVKNSGCPPPILARCGRFLLAGLLPAVLRHAQCPTRLLRRHAKDPDWLLSAIAAANLAYQAGGEAAVHDLFDGIIGDAVAEVRRDEAWQEMVRKHAQSDDEVAPVDQIADQVVPQTVADLILGDSRYGSGLYNDFIVRYMHRLMDACNADAAGHRGRRPA